MSPSLPSLANEKDPRLALRRALGGNVTVGNLIDTAAAAYPTTDALVFFDHTKTVAESERLTYRQYKEKVDQLAKSLMAMGIQKGDNVAIWMPNVIEWAIVQMATNKIGAANVSVNTMLKTYETEHILTQSDSKAIFMIADASLETDYMGILYGLAPELQTSEFGRLKSSRLPFLKSVITLSPSDRSKQFAGAITFDKFMEVGKHITDEELMQRQNSVTENDVAQILYTSGTTGLPKGVALLHKGVIENSYVCGLSLGCNHGDVQFNPLPLFHIGCSHLGTYCSPTLGLTLVSVDRWEGERGLQIIQQERATAIIATPTHFTTMMQHPDFEKYDVTSLRTGIMGATAVPVQLFKDVIRRMHLPELTITFGQTETCGIITQTGRDAPVELRAETVGVAQPGVEVVIMDTGTHRILPPGEVGEICARSSNNMKGYYKDPKATAQTIDSDGWLHLGDLGTLDNDGNLRFRGRLKDMIIVGGENVYAAEVEQFLLSHPKVTAAFVIGVPDAKYGEVPMAYLQTSGDITLEEIRAFCKGKIASFKIPRHIASNVELPMTPTAKIQKFKLREMAISQFGLSK